MEMVSTWIRPRLLDFIFLQPKLIMQTLKTPNGLKAIGYSSADIPALVEGTLPQHRVTKLSPRPAGPEDLARLFEDAMVAW